MSPSLFPDSLLISLGTNDFNFMMITQGEKEKKKKKKKKKKEKREKRAQRNWERKEAASVTWPHCVQR